MKVSVLLPARNEEKLIESTVRDIYRHLNGKKYPFELIIIVNGSDDRTEEIIKNLFKHNKRIRLIKSKPGYGYALKQGLLKAKGDYIVIYNVDFYDLKLIELIDIDMYGKDFIIGSKRAHWSSDKRSRSRKLVSTGFNLYLKAVHGFKGSDTHGIKLLKKDVLKKIYKKCSTNSGIFDTELVIRAQREGFQIADFPVDVEEKRPPRFSKRILNTPVDIYYLSLSLWKNK